jgi:hypothetical protein
MKENGEWRKIRQIKGWGMTRMGAVLLDRVVGQRSFFAEMTFEQRPK